MCKQRLNIINCVHTINIKLNRNTWYIELLMLVLNSNTWIHLIMHKQMSFDLLNTTVIYKLFTSKLCVWKQEFGIK